MSPTSWSGPEDTWPTHPRPLADQALKRARRAGWHVKKSSGTAHVWGVITCGDPSLPREQRCSASVMSTSGPTDGSETARVIDNVIRKCPHARDASGRYLREEAQDLAESATKCLAAAKSLNEANQHHEFVEDYLNQALQNADEADQFLERALLAESAADGAAAAAGESANEAGVSVTSGTKHLAVVADTRATAAKRLIAREADREARMLRARCDDIRQQAQLLLAQL